MSSPPPLVPSPNRASALLDRVSASIHEVVIGKSDVIELLLTAVLCEGHVLLEDVPGTGKTLLARALSRALGVTFRRIQFTPDLLPSDITGSSIFNQQTHAFEFRPGPLFAQIVLADEINRATPRTQAALLEAMEERQVTSDGVTKPLERPFLVVATQNPVELEGTFPLPEAQLDRFLFQLKLGYPDADEERAILVRNGASEPAVVTHAALTLEELRWLQQQVADVYVSEDVQRYIVSIVRATRDSPGVALGASPRAGIALYRSVRALACIRGRSYVLPDDVKMLTSAVLGHRMILSQQARLKGQRPGDVLAQILERVPVPVETIAEASAAHA